MEILILEDEKRAANQLKKMIKSIISDPEPTVYQFSELEDGMRFLKENTVNLLFLDLNLNGFDGFEILKNVSGESFETIITSAYKERAIDAFNYGVLDFVSKPYKFERLRKAILRYENNNRNYYPVKYLVVRKSLFNLVIKIEEILFLKAQGHYTLINLISKNKELHHKSIGKLLKVLPRNFERVHKSFVVNIDVIEQFNSYEGSKYELVLKGGKIIPIGRKYLTCIKPLFE